MRIMAEVDESQTAAVTTGPAGRHDEEACRIAFRLTLNSLKGTESIQRTASHRLLLLRDLAKSRSG